MHRVLELFAALTDDELIDRVSDLAARERRATAELVAALTELERRKLYLPHGCASLFAYCTRVLHLSEHAAYNRIEAARTVSRFPIVLDRLADGSLSLSAIRLLAPVLAADNHVRLVEAASQKSKRDVELLVVGERPQPDAAAVSPAVATPLTPERFKIQFTASREFHDKLRRAQALMRHAIPDGDPAAILERGLDLLLTTVQKRRTGLTERPRAARTSKARSRHIPAAVKREVWRRDNGRCAFVGTHGRCAERAFLEFHHVIPFVDGGAATTANIELRCRAHNAYEAGRICNSMFDGAGS
jgi:hypothetical protein